MRKEKGGRSKAHTTTDPANTEQPRRLLDEPVEKEPPRVKKGESAVKGKSYSH